MLLQIQHSHNFPVRYLFLSPPKSSVPVLLPPTNSSLHPLVSPSALKTSVTIWEREKKCVLPSCPVTSRTGSLPLDLHPPPARGKCAFSLCYQLSPGPAIRIIHTHNSNLGPVPRDMASGTCAVLPDLDLYCGQRCMSKGQSAKPDRCKLIST